MFCIVNVILVQQDDGQSALVEYSARKMEIKKEEKGFYSNWRKDKTAEKDEEVEQAKKKVSKSWRQRGKEREETDRGGERRRKAVKVKVGNCFIFSLCEAPQRISIYLSSSLSFLSIK